MSLPILHTGPLLSESSVALISSRLVEGLPFPAKRRLCCRGPPDTKWRGRREAPRSKSVQTNETLQHSRGFSSLSPAPKFAFSLRTHGEEFLARSGADARRGSGTRNEEPSEPAIARLKAFRRSSVPNRSVERIGGPDSAEILRERRLHDVPMRAAVGGQKNGADAADNPAHLIRWSGTGEQINKDSAGLVRPGGAAILGEFDQSGAAGAPNHIRSRR